MAREFLSILPRRGPEAFENFIKVLMSCEQQKFIAKELDPVLAQKYDNSAASSVSDSDISRQVSVPEVQNIIANLF